MLGFVPRHPWASVERRAAVRHCGQSKRPGVLRSYTNFNSRQYYERTNLLIQQYIYIDRLLDSSLPHDLLNEYNISRDQPSVPATISEEQSSANEDSRGRTELNVTSSNNKKIKRTPRDLYKVPSEDSPLLEYSDDEDGPRPEIPGMTDDSVESGDRIVQVAIYVNLAANIFLLGGKMAVIVLTSSLSVLASLVDGALDLLSTVIVWTTTRLIATQDRYRYPVGRRRLEPIGVLVFSVIMVTCFFQVALECFNRLNSGDHSIIQLGVPSISIMASTVVIKALCWVWCRVIKNSSVQALAQDAATDVVFNLFSIIFPLGKLLFPTAKYAPADIYSWILREPLVARRARWSSPLGLRYSQLGWHFCRAYPQPHWRRCYG